jgi:hypothetical protein
MRVRDMGLSLGGMVGAWCCGNDVLSLVDAYRCVTSGAGVRDVGVGLFAFKMLGTTDCKRY